VAVAWDLRMGREGLCVNVAVGLYCKVDRQSRVCWLFLRGWGLVFEVGTGLGGFDGGVVWCDVMVGGVFALLALVMVLSMVCLHKQ